MESKVEKKEIQEQPIVSVRTHTPLSEIGEVIGSIMGEAFGYVFQRGARPAGPPFAIYHDEDFKEEDIDVEFCVPVDRVLEPSGRLTSRTLEGGLMLSYLHVGPYSDLGQAYTAVGAFMQENGLEGAGPPREVYLVGPDQVSDPSELRTELLWPIK